MKSFLCITLMKNLFLFSFSLIIVGEAFSFQSNSTFVPVDESKLWIEGSSNVNEFECYAEEYTGEATLPELTEPSSKSSSVLNVSNEVLLLKIDIRVNSFECGKDRMNADLRKALKADKFPEISFLYEDATIISNPESEGKGFKLRVQGLLTVAGTTKEIQFITEAYYMNEQRVRARGETEINMIDYGVTPPTALMGLIRANEELTVNFDLIAEPKNVR